MKIDTALSLTFIEFKKNFHSTFFTLKNFKEPNSKLFKIKKIMHNTINKCIIIKLTSLTNITFTHTYAHTK